MNTQDTNIEQMKSHEVANLFAALAIAQGKVESALKDKKNPFFKSSYADLASVWEACREPLSSNGLSVVQTVEGTKTDMYLVTWLCHSSGQWMKSKLPLLTMKQDPQALGSAITYGRRYALAAMVGIYQEDDDGEKSMQRKKAQEKEEIDQNMQKNRISSEKALEIQAILDECGEQYKEWVFGFIKKQYNCSALDQLPADIYERVKSGAIKNMEENFAKQRALAGKEI